MWQLNDRTIWVSIQVNAQREQKTNKSHTVENWFCSFFFNYFLFFILKRWALVQTHPETCSGNRSVHTRCIHAGHAVRATDWQHHSFTCQLVFDGNQRQGEFDDWRQHKIDQQQNFCDLVWTVFAKNDWFQWQLLNPIPQSLFSEIGTRHTGIQRHSDQAGCAHRLEQIGIDGVRWTEINNRNSTNGPSSL